MAAFDLYCSADIWSILYPLRVHSVLMVTCNAFCFAVHNVILPCCTVSSEVISSEIWQVSQAMFFFACYFWDILILPVVPASQDGPNAFKQRVKMMTSTVKLVVEVSHDKKSANFFSNVKECISGKAIDHYFPWNISFLSSLLFSVEATFNQIMEGF